MNKILEYPELRVNPFGDRICKVFSSSNDGDCTFEDFLDMMSVFSEAAPKSVKAEHAFRIFGKVALKRSRWKKKLNKKFNSIDFDGDDMLGLSDLKQVIERLIGDQNRLPESDMKFLIQVSEHPSVTHPHALSLRRFWTSKLNANFIIFFRIF